MEAFGWYKETLIFLKGNKVLLLLVTTSLSGGITQTLRLDTAQDDKVKAVREVAEGFQMVMSKPEKPTVIMQKCGNCAKSISSHIKELH